MSYIHLRAVEFSLVVFVVFEYSFIQNEMQSKQFSNTHLTAITIQLLSSFKTYLDC